MRGGLWFSYCHGVETTWTVYSLKYCKGFLDCDVYRDRMFERACICKLGGLGKCSPGEIFKLIIIFGGCVLPVLPNYPYPMLSE